jgi:hypothetical protein
MTMKQIFSGEIARKIVTLRALILEYQVPSDAGYESNVAIAS